jgi:hypothetical protein
MWRIDLEASEAENIIREAECVKDHFLKVVHRSCFKVDTELNWFSTSLNGHHVIKTSVSTKALNDGVAGGWESSVFDISFNSLTWMEPVAWVKAQTIKLTPENSC